MCLYDFHCVLLYCYFIIQTLYCVLAIGCLCLVLDFINNIICYSRHATVCCIIYVNGFRYYMGVFGYDDGLSLLCQSFEGLKEMLFICEHCAIDYKIMFNSKKSKFMCFPKKIGHGNKL